MVVKAIAVFLSSFYVSWALRNSSCSAPTQQEILIGNNVRIQATKTICDDYIKLSISETIERGSYQPEVSLIPEKETPSNKNLRSLLITGKLLENI